MIRTLTISALTGLQEQIFSLNDVQDEHEYFFNGDYFDANSCFWHQQLSENNIRKNINKLLNHLNKLPIEIEWATKYSEKFILKLNEAKSKLHVPNGVPQDLFICLETLQIACDIGYYAETAPYKLDINIGFACNSDSAKELKERCLLPYCNPYLKFIEDRVIPIIKREQPDVLYISGKPNIASFATAVLAKKLFPNLLVGIVNHSSEYYSMNKIQSLLLNNHNLFEVFDFVILDASTYTVRKINDTLSNQKKIDCVPNLIYTLDDGKTILRTEYKNKDDSAEYFVAKHNLPINIKIFPNNHCYWNKCSFCGINAKYLHNKPCLTWDIEKAVCTLKLLEKNHIARFWAIDEAIPVDILKSFAQKIQEKGLTFEWHIRTRIEKELLDDEICTALANSGLKNILLGFESASKRILKMMNKTDNYEDYLDIAERIVAKYNKRGISVHFPAIIGFPTETIQERCNTIDFLEYLKRNYPLFSYNVNVLELDVSSRLYKRFEQYDIDTLLYPCKPSDFIGNTIQWGNDIELLKIQQQETMRKMFSWYPDDSRLDIITYYKLLEYTRIPFFQNKMFESTHTVLIDENKDSICFNQDCEYMESADGQFILFNSNRYRYVIGGDFLKKIYGFKNWIPCIKIIELYPETLKKELLTFLQKLADYKIVHVRR